VGSLPRRRFITSVAGPVLASAAVARATRAQSENPIVIVGAGLAGLRAADLIRAAGGRVVVLEARGQAGGRVRTLRAPFSDRLYGEAGAARIANAHGRVLRLVADAGLTLMPFAPSAGAPVIATPLGRWRLPEELGAAGAALKLRSDETGNAPGALAQRYVGPLPAELKDARPLSPDVLHRMRDYDRVTWPEWLKSRGASPGAIALMTLGGDSRELSALYVLQQMALLGGSNQFYKIEGGMQRLVQALLVRAAGTVRFNAVVTRVEQHARGVAVGYLDRGRATSIAASRVIFTNPFSTLQHVSMQPALPAAKASAVAGLAYYPGTRILLQSKTRFWEKQGLSGSARTSDPAELWDAAHEQNGPRGLLSVTVGRTLTLNEGLTLAARVFPAIRNGFERGAVVPWSQEPWSRGAFAVFRPGQLTAWASEMSRPDGRMYFAGEHTSPWSGWMEGALESGERAAAEVLVAAGL
jgi:monoamine oxidase